jgi:hypothetical protein
VIKNLIVHSDAVFSDQRILGPRYEKYNFSTIETPAETELELYMDDEEAEEKKWVVLNSNKVKLCEQNFQYTLEPLRICDQKCGTTTSNKGQTAIFSQLSTTRTIYNGM